MSAVTVRAPRIEGRVRPVDPARDMGAIADLIELAFRSELDHSGNSLVADLRKLATLGPLLTIIDRVTHVAGGFVWERDGRVIGNTTVTLENAAEQRWFISNVAVHPDHQGQGIGQRLMEAALAHIRRHGGRLVTLQVRTDNEPAQKLYRRLGFQRYDTIVELIRPGALPVVHRSSLNLRRLKYSDWPALFDLARATTPIEAQRVRALTPEAFRPSPGQRAWEWFSGLFSGRQSGRWGLEREGSLVAVISMLVEYSYMPARLDLAVHPDARGPLEGPLADFGLAMINDVRPRSVAATVSTSHAEALRALRERHFTCGRSLDQLALMTAKSEG